VLSFLQSLCCIFTACCGGGKKQNVAAGSKGAGKTRKPKAAGKSRTEKKRDKKMGKYASLNAPDGYQDHAAARGGRNVMQLTASSALNDL
jgi:hypothetical protein